MERAQFRWRGDLVIWRHEGVHRKVEGTRNGAMSSNRTVISQNITERRDREGKEKKQAETEPRSHVGVRV